MTTPEILGKISQEHPRWKLYYLRIVLSIFKEDVFICFNQCTLKMMKNAFSLKALFVFLHFLQIFTFFPDFLIM